jgi:(p)ppGpp synthase/HD superfamily hydrolase
MLSIKQAIEFAEKAHATQKYKDEPYVNHPKRVALQMPNDKLQVIALLHDVLEDTTATKQDLITHFGSDVAEVVFILTRKENETYLDYIQRIKLDPDATLVKIADLMDNLGNIPSNSLRKRYEKALQILR